MRAFALRLGPMATRVATVALAATALAWAGGAAAEAAVSGALTRYPYLTDSVQTSITVNWATDTSGSTGALTWGPPGSCAAHSTAAASHPITVGAVPELQWVATIPITPDTAYCYRALLDGIDLLGTDPSPQFTSQAAAGSSAPFTFAVLGDWGQVYAGGQNGDQANVMRQIASSGARFAVMTGDTGYNAGGQLEYGDLQQKASNVSGVFGPSYWAAPGRSVPVFNVTGNHGFENGETQILNWPEQHAAAGSGGTYQMESYPSVNGSAPGSYPSLWYAFDAGQARFYALTASWADSNVGTGTAYTDDVLAHWAPSSPQYQWLEADLAAHPNAVKLAFWHYPLYSDNVNQKSDLGLQGGAGTLQGLLNRYGVAMAFNGHAHGYQRNAADAGGMVSYVFGNAGGALGPLGVCHDNDLYAIASGGTHCGAAPAGLANDRVFGFGKVTVAGRQVTVTPTDELGRTFDEQTYNFGATGTDTVPPSQPGSFAAVAGAGPRVDLSWTPSTDNTLVTGYKVYRNGAAVPLATLGSAATSYPDTAVAPATAYTYQVSAVDAAGNESTKASATVTTPPQGATFSFAPSDDATVDATSSAANYGAAARLTVDASPVDRSLLKFTVSGTGGCPVASARLRLTVGGTAGDESVYGGDVYSTGNGWSEALVSYLNAPQPGTTKLASVAGPVALGSTQLFDVTAAVPGDGVVSLLAMSPSGDGARYYSKESGSAAQAPRLQVTCAPGGPDTTAPSIPTGLNAAATGPTSVSLGWTASTDAVGVTGYRVYRNGGPVPIATVGGAVTGFLDGAASPATSYTYQVSAVDAAGNESAKASATAQTPPAAVTRTFSATDDATVTASQPNANAGTGSRLAVDASPVNWTLLRFTVSGTGGCPVTGAKLRLTVGGSLDDSSVYGGDLYATGTGWSQSTVSYATSPQPGPVKIASVPGPVALNSTYLFDVTPLVAGDGEVNLLLKSPNGDGARYYSSESGNAAQAPQLQVLC